MGALPRTVSILSPPAGFRRCVFGSRHAQEWRPVTPVIIGSASRKQGAVQRARRTCVASRPSARGGKAATRLKRWPRDDAPFSALRVQNNERPHMGTLTFIRVYSGKLEKRIVGCQIDPRQSAKESAGCQDAREQARGHHRSLRRRHLRGRVRDTNSGDHALPIRRRRLCLRFFEFPGRCITKFRAESGAVD